MVTAMEWLGCLLGVLGAGILFFSFALRCGFPVLFNAWGCSLLRSTPSNYAGKGNCKNQYFYGLTIHFNKSSIYHLLNLSKV
jgi:hypothetical protein